VIVATSTLELGIDVGDLDRVVSDQFDSHRCLVRPKTGTHWPARWDYLFETCGIPRSRAFLLRAVGVVGKFAPGCRLSRI